MIFKLAALHAWREKHNSEYLLLGLVLGLALFSQTIIMCLSFGLNKALFSEASTLLGADLIVESSYPLADNFQRIATELQLRSSKTVQFMSMASAKDQLQLSDILAINETFPLRGNLKVESLSGIVTHAPPPVGEIWMEESLAARLGIHFNDAIQIGNKVLKYTGKIIQHPIGTEGLSLAPIVYVNANDLSAMQVLQPGSRASYRLYIAGTKTQLSQYRSQLSNEQSQVKWLSAVSGKSSLNRIFLNAQRYLILVLVIQVFLAAISIALCAHQYNVRQSKVIAIWRCLGATQNTILEVHGLGLLLYASFIILISILLAYSFSYLIFTFIASYGLIASLTWQPALWAIMTGLIMLLGFAFPSIFQLQRVSAFSVLQNNQNEVSGYVMSIYGMTLLILNGLYLFLSPDWLFSLKVGAYLIVASIFAAFFTYYLFALIRHLKSTGPMWWRFGLGFFNRQKGLSIIQCLVFALVVMLLLLIQIIRSDFMDATLTQLPKKTPNTFLINIQDNELISLKSWFDTHSLQDVEFYPIVRGRMTHFSDRALNLTWMQQLPKDNRVIEGINWDKVANGDLVVSIERGFAERQKVFLNDILEFQISEQSIKAKVVQIREVNWQSFKPNFFIIFPPGVLEQMPHSYITSMYILPADKPLLNELSKQFPEISILDIDAILSKMRQWIERAALGIEGLLMLVFILGVLLMYSTILSSLKERIQESALLKIFGANQKIIGQIFIVEFAILGAVSGLLGSVLALAIAKYLAVNYFDIAFSLRFHWALLGIAGSILVTLLFALIALRQVFFASPMILLREQ